MRSREPIFGKPWRWAKLSSAQSLYPLALIVCVAIPANAALHTFDLIGSNPHYVNDTTLNQVAERFDLIDSSTGLNRIPGFTLSVGDLIRGYVTLDNIVTVGGPNQRILIGLMGTGAASSIEIQGFFRLEAYGVQTHMFGWSTVSGDNGGPITLGGDSLASPFFNRIYVDTQVTRILDDNSQSISSVALPDGQPWLYLTPVPEPSTWVVLAAGGTTLIAVRRQAIWRSSVRRMWLGFSRRFGLP